MISAEIGVATPLELMLFDGAITKGIRALIRTTAGTLIATVNLTHIGEGLYTANWTPSVIGYYHVNYIVYTDGTYATEDLYYTRRSEPYRVTFSGGIDPTVFAQAIWDALLSDFHDPNSFGEAIALLLANTHPEAIAGDVWDIFFADHHIPNTFGDMVQAIWQYCREHLEQLTNPVWGLDMLYALIQNQTTAIITDVSNVDIKVSALTPLIVGVDNHLTNEILINRNMLQSIAINDVLYTSQIIDAIHITDSKVDSVYALVGTLQNNTTTRFVVPERLIKPTTGIKTYQFHLRLYDTAGAPKAPDSTPRIRVRRLDTGVDIVLNDPMTQDGVKVGAYYYVFPIASGTADYQALVEATVVEDGIARYIPSVTEVSEFEADLNAIQAQIAAVDSIVVGTQNQITNPTYGLAALKTGEETILTAIGNEAVTLGLIKAKTDLLSPTIATRSDIEDVLNALSYKPTLAEITDVVTYAKEAIMGPGNRNITDVYNRWDISSVLKTNDPRLAFLDAPISSRSTLIAADVWTYGNRTLTSSHLTPADIKAIWDYSGSQATTLGSLGKLLVDNLDAQVSTRATQGEVASLLIGVAQESTLVNATTDIINALNECKSKLNNITVKVLQIKAKTDTLPASPASEATLQSGIDIIRTDIAEVDNRTIQIKVDTDRIPTDPAKESSVHAIPTNPLLTTDARLNNLDARISTRSTLTVADLDFLASDTELANAQNLILSEIDQTQTQVSSLTDTTNHIRSDVHTIQMTQATMTALLAAENAILTAIASIEDGPELSAAQVWSYPTRTITQDPASFGPDISQLATKTDVAAISAVNQYLNKMTTTFNPATGYQEVLVWAEKNGQEVTVASDCLIEIKDSLGAIKWSQSSSIPNGDGVFRFVNPIVVVQDSNYYITIKIKVDGALRITTQAFITVG